MNEKRIISFFILISFLAACARPIPTAIYITATPASTETSLPPLTNTPPIAATLPLAAGGSPAPTALPTLTATPTPPANTLTICLPTEPHSLYKHSGGDPESIWARNVILETLHDGPIDQLNFGYQPVLLEKLPSLKDGGATIQPVRVTTGEIIVDATGNPVELAKGVRYFDPGGSEKVYSGRGVVEVMQMTVTFELKAGLTWEDGQPLTADDALFAWQLAKDPDNRTADRYLANRALDPVVVDSRTFQLTFLPGFKDTLYFTRFPLPYPRHLYGQFTATQLAADERASRRPLSFGPFTLKEWAAGNSLTLAKNPRYFRAPEGLPRLEQIIFRFPADARQLVEWMRTGACQIGLAPPARDTFFDEQANIITSLASRRVFAVQHVSSTAFEHLDFNISPAEGYEGLAKNKLFENLKVRQAFAYCINRRTLIDTLLHGRSEIPAAYLPANHPFFDPNLLVRYTFDPEKGRALLQEAGWKDANGDGVLDKAGKALSLDYMFGSPGNTLREAIAAALETQLKQNCGIEIKPQALSSADLFGEFPDGVIFGRQYDLAQFSWIGGENDPSCSLYARSEWTGLGDGKADRYGIAGYPGGGNNVGYINPTFDELCQRALTSLDPAEKKAYHQQAMQIFSQEVPSLVLFFKPKIALVHPKVRGFTLPSTPDSVLWNIETLELVP